MMTSGSAAASSAHCIQSECLPACPNRLWPPADSISSGIQLPPAISGSTHSMKATRGLARPATLARNRVESALHVAHKRLAGFLRCKSAGNAANVGVDVGHAVGLERDDLDWLTRPRAGGGLHVAQG